MPTPDDPVENEEKVIEHAVLRLNAVATGIGLGMLCGIGLFVATLFLVLKGGPWTGQHLGLLGQYFPGYSVSVGGAFIGFVYAFIVGGAAGHLLAVIYNRFAR